MNIRHFLMSLSLYFGVMSVDNWYRADSEDWKQYVFVVSVGVFIAAFISKEE